MRLQYESKRISHRVAVAASRYGCAQQVAYTGRKLAIPAVTVPRYHCTRYAVTVVVVWWYMRACVIIILLFAGCERPDLSVG